MFLRRHLQDIGVIAKRILPSRRFLGDLGGQPLEPPPERKLRSDLSELLIELLKLLNGWPTADGRALQLTCILGQHTEDHAEFLSAQRRQRRILALHYLSDDGRSRRVCQAVRAPASDRFGEGISGGSRKIPIDVSGVVVCIN
jgi:hypothetical protein